MAFQSKRRLTYFDETRPDAIPGSDSSFDVTRFTLGPELKHHLETGSGASIEPFAFFKSTLDLAESDWNAPVGRNTVGGGIQLAKPDNIVSAPLPTLQRIQAAEEKLPPTRFRSVCRRAY